MHSSFIATIYSYIDVSWCQLFNPTGFVKPDGCIIFIHFHSDGLVKIYLFRITNYKGIVHQIGKLATIVYSLLVKIYFSLKIALYGIHSFILSNVKVSYPVVQNQALATALLTLDQGRSMHQFQPCPVCHQHSFI
jgi:hypothetical protein